MTKNLEASYRSALRWYPPAWRERNGDAIVGTLLDVAEAHGHTRAATAERLNLAATGIMTRLNLFVPPGVRSQAAGIALATGTAFSVAYLILQYWVPGGPAMLAIDPGIMMPNMGFLVFAMWPIAFVFAVAGLHLLSKVALGLSVVMSTALPILVSIPELHWSGPATRTMVFTGLLALIALCGAPRHRIRLALTTTGIAGIVFGLCWWGGGDAAYSFLMPGLALRGFDRYLWYEPLNDAGLGNVLTLVILVAVGFALARQQSIATVIGISAIPWFAVWIIQLATPAPNNLTVAGLTLRIAAMLLALVIASIARLIADNSMRPRKQTHADHRRAHTDDTTAAS